MKLKQRLAGIIVLVILMLIVVPLLFTGSKNSVAANDISVSIPTPPPTPTIKPVVMQNVPQTTAQPATQTKAIFTVAGKPIATEAGPVITVPKVTKKVMPIKKIVVVSKAPVVQKNKVVSRKKWTVQLASFDSEKHAVSLVRKLQAKKKHAYLRSSKVGSKNIYRVYVGPVATRTKADSLQKVMHKEFKLSGLVVDYAVYF